MLGDAKGATWPTDEAGYFQKIGWLHAPAADKGGEPKNLSHPIVYIVNPKSQQRPARGDARRLRHAALLQHPARGRLGAHRRSSTAQASMPAYKEAWYLKAATPMLARSTFIPNHPDFGRYNGILFKALAGRRDRRLSPEEAVEFLEDELSNELGDNLKVVELRLNADGAGGHCARAFARSTQAASADASA